MKILLVDLEVAPNVSYTWGIWEQDAIEVKQEWYILSFCARWLGGKTITRGLPDYPLFKKDKRSDRELVKELWELLNEADLVIAHNGDRFDLKKANTKFVEHGLLPPSGYNTVDTLKIAQKYFAFNSNKLDELGKHLGVGRKVKHGGFEMWRGCMEGNVEDFKKMKKYNMGDTLLLERVYYKLRPWLEAHPNTSFDGKCPKCSGILIKRGFGFTRTGKYPRYACKNCHGWSRGENQKLTNIR